MAGSRFPCLVSVRRVLLRLAFDGHQFRGTQRQPHKQTVNDAILGALDEVDLLAPDPHLRAQGRKDSRASARDYPIALDVTSDLATIARALAGATTGIVPWAGAVVEEGYDPRTEAKARTYRYILTGLADTDAKATIQAWRAFEGTHDFSEFARLRPKMRVQDPVRTMQAADGWMEDGALVLEVTGESFLWNQVRRMAGAAHSVGTGRLPLDRLEQALHGDPLGDHVKLPAEGLVLHRVELPLETPPLLQARRIALERLAAERARAHQRVCVLDAIEPPLDA